MTDRNMSHDSMSGFKRIDSSSIEVSESNLDKYSKILKDYFSLTYDFIYAVLSDIVLPLLFVVAIIRSLVAIIMFKGLPEVFVATITTMVLYYIQYLIHVKK
mgnify:CR=1 FL=1